MLRSRHGSPPAKSLILVVIVGYLCPGFCLTLSIRQPNSSPPCDGTLTYPEVAPAPSLFLPGPSPTPPPPSSAGRAVTSLSLNRVGSSVLSSAVCGLGPSCFFLGSCVGDSLLIRFRERKSASLLLQGARDDECAVSPVEPPAKRARGEVRVGASLEELEEDEEDELHDMLYATPPSANGTAKPLAQLVDGHARKEALSKPVPSAPSLPIGAGPRQYELTVLDSFAGIGPVRDLTVGDAQEAGSAPTEIVVAAGHGKNGGLAVLQGGVFPEVIREVELPGVQARIPDSSQTFVARCKAVPRAPLRARSVRGLQLVANTTNLKYYGCIVPRGDSKGGKV